jgi:hypothetical protein
VRWPARVSATAAEDFLTIGKPLRSRRDIDRKLSYLVRQRAALRAQITLQQRSGSPDAARIADYQRRILELEAMMQRLFNPTGAQ